MRSSRMGRRGSMTRLRRASSCSTVKQDGGLCWRSTDGEDTFSQDATLESVIATGQRLGLPVYTLGTGERKRRSRAATFAGWRVPPEGNIILPAMPASCGRSMNRSPSGYGRATRWSIRAIGNWPMAHFAPFAFFIVAARRSAGETAIFIPGMVVPAGGWPLLFLGLLCVLGVLLVLPSRIVRRAG